VRKRLTNQNYHEFVFCFSFTVTVTDNKGNAVNCSNSLHFSLDNK